MAAAKITANTPAKIIVIARIPAIRGEIGRPYFRTTCLE
jgi:hypothetical protein